TKKIRANKMERGEFIDFCLETLEEIRPQYIYDWKRIGLSADFDLFYTTINEHCRKISQESFIDLFKLGRIKRKDSPIMICPKCRTAIAQVELEDAQKDSFLNHIKVPVIGTKEHLVFATTRPELLPACIGISVHPDDKRYKDLIGKYVKMPLMGAKIKITADEETDMDYGTGVVYYCSYGGMECIEWMSRHTEVKPINVMDVNGIYNSLAGKYEDLNSIKARTEIIEDLKKEGCLVKQEPIKHIVNTHERCGADIEFVATEQWFIQYLDLKDRLLEAGAKLNWNPPHMRNRLDNWIKGLKWDWCLSRQKKFGVPIPVWYCKKCSEVIIADKKQLPVDPLQDKPSTEKCPKCGCNEFVPE
ncbi:MAG: class I tRNA ligase family protein, partial [Candidatus Aenigmarchaeota archaeon]|nr:class I tRNA ligase family protein [Candidatus Aenigmarchaeota archaeon]